MIETKRKAPPRRKATGAVDPVSIKAGMEALAEAEAAAVEAMPTPMFHAVEVTEAVLSPAVESDTNPVAAEAAATIEQGTIEMATIVSPTEATDKAQAMFGDVQGRVKTAFDRSAKVGEEMVDFAKGNVEALMASARVAAKASETLGQEAADYSRKSFESATAAFKSFATVKSPTELFQLQSEFAKGSFDGMVAEASKMSELMMKFAGDLTQPLSNRYALAAEKLKTAL